MWKQAMFCNVIILSFTRVKAKIKKVKNEKPTQLYPKISKKTNPSAGCMQMF